VSEPTVTVGGHLVIGDDEDARAAHESLVRNLIDVHGMPSDVAARTPMTARTPEELAEVFTAYQAAGADNGGWTTNSTSWPRPAPCWAEALTRRQHSETLSLTTGNTTRQVNRLRQGDHVRVRGSTRAAVVAALVGGLLSAPATEAAPAAEAGERTRAQTYTVTLITGDQVRVAKHADTWEILDIEPAQRLGADGGFLQHSGPDGVTVIPRSAVRLLRDGRLDDAFFDVTGLIAQGYDDAHTDGTPLLVQAPNKRVATTLGHVTRELPAASLTAVTAEKTPAAFETISAHPGTKVWLNGKAFPALDQSVPQVRAPEAWAAGHTGAGATIAVLDTGYDPAHPDLAGVVTGERDFLGLPGGIRDQVGHGTHVASTAAGRGTASGGRYTGVAKGADLMIGKVCDRGGCPFDAILAGMRWAAESGARVVNMSFGGGAGDGTDPVETELNRLSAEYGTLFVVAAGNSGTFEKVSTPAAADAALAVASVSKQDALSDFSSRGPRIDDFVLKPDIAAPGESIVAARAAGTLPDEAVDEHHARLDGTSMATPHVAGAAAILAARHPDWDGARIKAALMSTAQPVDAGVYEQGAGRLDVARAVEQPVTASPASLSLGFVRWPHDTVPEPKTVTYRNAGTADVTLSVALDTWDETGQPAPAGMFRADRTEVTVPAGGEAAVTVTFDPAAGPVGLYGGRLVATSGDTVVQTTVGGYKEPESYELTLRMIDRNGVEIPAGSSAGVAVVQNLDEADVELFPVFSNEPVRLPAGRYAVVGTAETPVDGQVNPALAMLAAPDVTLEHDTAVTMDARSANKVDVRVDEPEARVAAGTAGMLIDNGKVGDGYVVGTLDDVYATPTTGSAEGFLYYTRAQVEKPIVRLNVSAPESFEVPVRWVPGSPMIEGDRPLTAVDVGHATPAELAAKDVAGKLAVFTLGAGEEETFEARLRAIADAGAAAAFFYFSEQISIGVGEQPSILAAYTLRPEGTRLAALGTASVTLSGIAASPYRYELAFPHRGGIPADVEYRPRKKDLATVRATYHAQVEGGVGYIDYSTEAYGFGLGGGLWSTVVPLPVERTEYYSPSPVTWDMSLRTAPSREAAGPEQGYQAAARQYRVGERLSVAWNKAVVGPALAVHDERYTGRPHLVYREGDTVIASLPLLSDAGRRSGFPRPEEYSFADTGDTSLYANGELVSSSGVPGFGEFTVSAGAADYRLVADVTRDHPVWPLSTKVSAEWTFSSAHTDTATPLPLLTVGFDPKVDLLNHAPAGRKVTIPVSVDRQPGATGGKATLDTVEVSVDDGKTWQRVRPTRQGKHWVVTVRNPETGFVSLRANASDSTGDTVTETVIRAYRVR
jgi:subtilisin family serine protease